MGRGRRVKWAGKVSHTHKIKNIQLRGWRVRVGRKVRGWAEGIEVKEVQRQEGWRERERKEEDGRGRGE